LQQQVVISPEPLIYMIFGKLQSAVTPFSRIYNDMTSSTLSLIVLT